mmetsp:Transcript_40130/g.63701  ORF Transcript_40130/g.63701 Transcript_40130/m.63701 type:complete len:325 (-) Transcript_40130:52-1026(-)
MAVGCWRFTIVIAVIATSLRVAFAAGSNSTAQGLENLDQFCSKNLGTKDTDANTVVDCSCCATSHLSGDYGSQVALQYGGHLTTAIAVEAGQDVGNVPAWSLGNFVPKVACEKGNVMTCICEGKGNVRVDEPSCKTGPPCQLDAPVIEWPSTLSEGIPSQPRDQALGRVAGAKQAPVENKRQDYCLFMARPVLSSAGTSLQKRVPLGSGRCEDVNPKQCHLFYARNGPDGWRHCQSIISPKQCNAKVIKETKARENSKDIDAWGAKHAFVPGAWPVEVDADGTVIATKQPPVEVFEKYADNLPPRTFKGTPPSQLGLQSQMSPA